MRRIYLDYNASTPLASEVVEAIRPFLGEHYGNPSSMHWAGQPAREAVEAARAEVAALLGANPTEIVFTSGGTEANNYAIKGAYFRSRIRQPHIVTTTIEHPAVLEPCRFLERLGARLTLVPVDSTGLVAPGDIRRAVTREIGRFARERGIVFHTDAAQTAGKIPTEVGGLHADMLSIAGHKLYAPKGVGALYVREGQELEPLMHGAGHEAGRRAGTENVLLIVALGAACHLARTDPCSERMRALRDFFWQRLQETFGPGVVLNGHPTSRLPNTLNVSFPGHLGQEVLDKLEGVAASTGSACHAGSHTMSPVLSAMGVKARVGLGAVRFSLGRVTTADEIEEVVQRLGPIVREGSK